MHRFQHRDCAAAWIGGPINPCIPMVSGNHPRLRKIRPLNLADDIPDTALGVVHLEPHVHAYGAHSANVVGERQSPLPIPRRLPTSEMLQDR